MVHGQWEFNRFSRCPHKPQEFKKTPSDVIFEAVIYTSGFLILGVLFSSCRYIAKIIV